MQNNTTNKRIAKNTALLYVRMLLTMGVTLYTSRVVLDVLGIEDYGIYNVVGGFVTMLGFLSNSMAVATQRFLSFEIGKKDFTQLKRVFSMSITIHFIIAFLILLLAETIGLWFVETKLIIPIERMEAAHWVYHFSILAFIVNIISVPYNAAIIAHERMDVFAYVSLLDVTLKLLIVYILQEVVFDKLKLYSILMFMIAIIIRIVYGIYCKKNFNETNYKFFWDNKIFKEIIGFSSWSLWGSTSSVLAGQGVNILINIFFGPVVNAARGIAYQVKGAVNGFVQNFQIAMNPQIIKSYAIGDFNYMHQIIIYGAKYSFFLIFTISLPIIIETKYILSLWLKLVPDYTVIFVQLVLINSIIESFSGPLVTAAQATGKIKLYQMLVGGMFMLIIPISYLFLKLGYAPEITLIVNIVISLINLLIRMILLKYLVKLDILKFVKKVILKVFFVCFLALILPLSILYYIDTSFLRFVTIFISSFLSSIFFIYSLGLNKQEKSIVLKGISKIKNILFKLS